MTRRSCMLVSSLVGISMFPSILGFTGGQTCRWMTGEPASRRRTQLQAANALSLMSPSLEAPSTDPSEVATLGAFTEEESQAVGCISHHEAVELLALRAKLDKGRRARGWYFQQGGVSLDLGKSETSVVVTEEGICLPAMGNVAETVLVATWEELQQIVDLSKSGQVGCYSLYGDGTKPWRVSTISLRTGRSAVLHPPLQIRGPPTLVLGSMPMHRLGGPDPITAIGPAEDTRRKLDALKMKTVYGKVLDTATGLGYTAIAASRCSNVREVVTVELDQAALELCRYNPWSSELFNGMQTSKIRLLQGDICEVVTTFPEGWFSAVIHDPPSPSICKSNLNLFSASFYSELYRVLRWRGRLFHHIGGNPNSKQFGPLYRAVIQKLEAAGFKSCVIQSTAQGIVAEKGEDRKSKKGRLYYERRKRNSRRNRRPSSPEEEF